MAADATLSVAVVAEVEGFKSGFNQVGVSIGDLQRKILAYKDIVANSLDTKVIAKYNAMIEATSAELTRLNSIGKKGFDSLGNSVLANGQKVAKGSNQAGMALTDLGRIAQDIPYGFQGIQNNLNPMIESFQRLKTETGSTGGALKAMGSSLMGPAGLGIALSVVSAAILLYQEYTRKAKKETDGLSSSVDVVSKSFEAASYKDALKNVDELRINIGLAKDGFLKKEEVLKQYNETIGKTTGEVNSLNEAETALNKNAEAYIKFTLLKATAQLALEAAAKKSFEAAQKLSQSDSDALGTVDDYLLSNPKLASIRKRSAERRKKEASDDLIKEKDAFLKIASSFQDQAAKLAKDSGFNFFDSNKGTKPNNSKQIQFLKDQKEILENELEELQKGFKAQAGSNPFVDLFKTIGDEITVSTNLIDNQIERFNGIISSIEPQAYTDALDEYLKATADFESGIKDIGENAISYVGDFFTSLGEAMASGDFSNFGQDILKAFAGFLGQLGQLFIKQGVAEIGFGIAKNLILPGSGVPNIAGGSGMIAAGAAISIGSGLIGAGGGRNNDSGPPRRRIPGFAKGVTNFSGGLAIVGEQGPELVDLPPGSDVIPNNRIGQISQGSQNIILSGSLGIRMGELFVELQREEKIRRRTS